MRKQIINSETNFKQYFIEEDNLRSLQNEVIFSILRRYNCFAGCHVCYVDKYFEKNKNEFDRFIPKEITKEQTDQWVDIFSNYNFATTTDDLYWMKHKQPHLFDWYKEHSPLFFFGAMTDNNFIRSWNILINEIDKPKGIYEFTFSDTWLSKVKVTEIVEKLNYIYSKFQICQIKIIQSDLLSLDWDCVKQITNWAKDRDLNVVVHHDAKTFNTIKLSTDQQQMSFATFGGDLYTVLGEADYLQYDSFFHNLIDAIDPLCNPYYTTTAFNLEEHVYNHMFGKIDVYKKYTEKLKYDKDDATIQYRNYFEWVSNHLVVNKDYNFIPILSLKPFHAYSKKLESRGWIKTNYGLLKTTTEPVKPLFEFKI
jgi:hypothetical protein